MGRNSHLLEDNFPAYPPLCRLEGNLVQKWPGPPAYKWHPALILFSVFAVKVHGYQALLDLK
jgi:hypothetical protein